MPELPDVETFKRYLNSTSLHQTIKDVQTDRISDMLVEISQAGLKQRLKGHEFTQTRRHGKHLFVSISQNGCLMLHFGMTGFLKYYKKPAHKPSHGRLQIEFENGFSLVYSSMRRLGQVGTTEDPDEFIRQKKLGPDALNDLSFEIFENKIMRGRGSIKSLLMNQNKLAGIGNVYSDEILFRSRFHPCDQVEKIKRSSAGMHRLYEAIGKVLQESLDSGANPGNMPDDFLIPNRRKGGSCPRCGESIRSIKCAGRTSYFCVKCQNGV